MTETSTVRPGLGAPPADDILVDVRNLRTSFKVMDGVVPAVDNVSFSLGRGQTLGIVGESGSGKSMTCLSILRLVPEPGGRIVGGSIAFDGEDLLAKSPEEMRQLRGSRIAMILQDPMASLNPAMTVGAQIAETLTLHRGLRGRALDERVLELLRQVRISDPERRVHAYPHQMSGGIRQRVAGAIAISCQPSLLIADEPTTSLDVTIQAQILRLLHELVKERGVSVLFTTHDLGTAHEICDRIVVMYAGQEMEAASRDAFFGRPAHPYTRRLLASVPTGTGELLDIPGEVPSLVAPPSGCRFHPRCQLRLQLDSPAICADVVPPLIDLGGEHLAACHFRQPGQSDLAT
jgi:oligopeptide/dipeptide ABC transporter ATP-binding protein